MNLSAPQKSIVGDLAKLRDLINDSIKTRPGVWRREAQGDWSKLWAAFDSLEDTQLAIEEFADQQVGRLGLYGLLQALIVQQDAIEHLEESLGLAVTERTAKAKLIRQIRNETIGHPSKTQSRGNKSKYEDGSITYTSLSAYLSDPGKLEYVVWATTGTQVKRIDLNDVIADQSEFLEAVLVNLQKQIEKTETEHREQFREDNLASLFDQTPYYISKLYTFEHSREYSSINFEFLVKQYESFKSRLIERYGRDVFDNHLSLPGMIDEIKRADELIMRLRPMMPLGQEVDGFNLDVYVDALSNSMDFMKTCAAEIDEKFNAADSKKLQKVKQAVEFIVTRGTE